MICYNSIEHYAQVFLLRTFETTENDFAILLKSNYSECVFIKSPWGIIEIKHFFKINVDVDKRSGFDFFNSLTKEKAEEYINAYIKQETDELAKSIAKRNKRIQSETKHKEKEQKQLEEFVRYSKEKEK